MWDGSCCDRAAEGVAWQRALAEGQVGVAPVHVQGTKFLALARPIPLAPFVARVVVAKVDDVVRTRHHARRALVADAVPVKVEGGCAQGDGVTEEVEINRSGIAHGLKVDEVHVPFED